MKKHLLIIVTHIILTSSCLQSADWISDHLPKTWRVDSKWRNQVKEIQERTGTATPIVFMNSDTEGLQAGVLNVGIGPCRFAIMSINQAQFQKDSSDLNIKTLAHETVHIDRKHYGINTTMLLASAIIFGSSPILKYIHLNIGKGCFITGLILATAGLLYPSNKKQIEHEADKGAFEKLNQLRLCNTLENLSKFYKSQPEWLSQLRAMNGYPTNEQMYEWSEEKCRECRQNEMNGTYKGFE